MYEDEHLNFKNSITVIAKNRTTTKCVNMRTHDVISSIIHLVDR